MLTKHLFYQICPLDLSDQWRFNIECLLPFLSVFNGRILLTIKTGDLMAPVEEVQAYFKHLDRVEYLLMPNDAALGEAVSFMEGLSNFQSENPKEWTFYAHTKGVSPKYLPEDFVSINHWVRRLYQKNLMSMDVMDRYAERYSFFGSFKRYGMFDNVPVNWHYSGSFYWFRHDVCFGALASIDCPDNYYLSEMLPGLVVPESEAYCFFDDGAQDVYRYGEHDWSQLEYPSAWFLWKRKLMIQRDKMRRLWAKY